MYICGRSSAPRRQVKASHAILIVEPASKQSLLALLQDGDRFWRMPEAYIRGNTIKYLRVPDEVIDKVRDDSYNRAGNTGILKAGTAMLMLAFASHIVPLCVTKQPA